VLLGCGSETNGKMRPPSASDLNLGRGSQWLAVFDLLGVETLLQRLIRIRNRPRDFDRLDRSSAPRWHDSPVLAKSPALSHPPKAYRIDDPVDKPRLTFREWGWNRHRRDRQLSERPTTLTACRQLPTRCAADIALKPIHLLPYGPRPAPASSAVDSAPAASSRRARLG
jgi:hypothetical protein